MANVRILATSTDVERMKLSNDLNSELLYVGFNQDHGCFVCGTNNGFRIYNCEPFKETFRREFAGEGGIGIVEMLFRCNILALVGGGRNPRWPPNKVMIWDDNQNSCIGELSFRNEVKNVKLRRDKVVVVLETRVYVYNFQDLSLLVRYDTTPNPRGLCCLCPNSTNSVLAIPGLQEGSVRCELFDVVKQHIIPAHESPLACIALNLDGTRLASASEKGTLIRVFDTLSGNLLQELRRGADRATIYCISFNFNSRWMCVSSDKGTVHIFSLIQRVEAPIDPSQVRTQQHLMGGAAKPVGPRKDAHNPKSTLSFMSGVLPKYFSSEWSFAQLRVPEVQCICAFGVDKNSIIVVGADGTFTKAIFDPENGGESIRKTTARFMKLKDQASKV